MEKAAIHEKKTLRYCQRNPSSFEDIFQLKTQYFSILIVWRFDANNLQSK